MVDISTLEPLRAVIARHGLQARKSLGQHFLLDLNLTRRVVRAAGPLQDHCVIEIGPGPGGLSRALVEADPAALILVERDQRCVEALEALRALLPKRCRIVAGDALKLPIGEFEEPPRRVVANLPYNIASALLINWLGEIAEDPSTVDSLTLMFQKEVAARLTAQPGNKTYGRLAVITQWLCQTSRLFDVPARAFTPSPKVTSSVIHLQPRSQPLAPAQFKTLERVTAAAFGQRRKMLRRSLTSLGQPSDQLLRMAEVDPNLRAEALDIAQFCALAQALDRLEEKPSPAAASPTYAIRR